MNDAAARAVKAVRQIVRLDGAVAVVADHMGAATKGLAALVIEWDDGPHAKLSTKQIADALKTATRNPGAVAQNIGDIGKALAGSVSRVEATYEVPFLAHATMEPMNCTVHVRKDGCEIWVGNQAIARPQATAAKTTGLPSDKVVVHNHLIGGWIRPAAGDRWCHARRPDRAACRRPSQARVDPRGRHPARHVPTLFLPPHIRRSR